MTRSALSPRRPLYGLAILYGESKPRKRSRRLWLDPGRPRPCVGQLQRRVTGVVAEAIQQAVARQRRQRRQGDARCFQRAPVPMRPKPGSTTAPDRRRSRPCSGSRRATGHTTPSAGLRPPTCLTPRPPVSEGGAPTEEEPRHASSPFCNSSSFGGRTKRAGISTLRCPTAAVQQQTGQAIEVLRDEASDEKAGAGSRQCARGSGAGRRCPALAAHAQTKAAPCC